MMKAAHIRTGVLAVHGSLALILGLIFFYLRGTMTNLFFEAIAVVVAVLLASTALIIAAITDWFAAFSLGMRDVHRFVFYLLAGIALAMAGIFLDLYPVIYMRWLVVLASVHALAFSISSLVSRPHRGGRTMYVFGFLSLIFSGALAGLVSSVDDLEATTLLGCYLCFTGIKVLFFAWSSHRMNLEADSNAFPVTGHMPATGR